jgi:hypothetical protein
LYGDGHLDEYVVFGLGFADNVELFDTEGKLSYHGLEGPHDAAGSFTDKTFELTKIFDDAHLLLSDAHKAKASPPY